MESKTELSLITYGLGNELKQELINDIINCNFVKPKGGLWASPVNSSHGWKKWCDEEDFGDTLSSFTFRYIGSVLKIDSLRDLEQIPWTRDEWIQALYPDFELMVQLGIDAMWLTVEGENVTRHSGPKTLYGWDCESVLIMNPSGIMQK